MKRSDLIPPFLLSPYLFILDSANKKYVDEKVGTWNTLFEKEETYNSSGSGSDDTHVVFSANQVDFSPLINANECSIELSLFGILSVNNITSDSTSLRIGFTGFPIGSYIPCGIMRSGSSSLNVNGFREKLIINNKIYGGSSNKRYSVPIPLFGLIGIDSSYIDNIIIGCNTSRKNYDAIKICAESDGIYFSFTNLHYKLKMEYKN